MGAVLEWRCCVDNYIFFRSIEIESERDREYEELCVLFHADQLPFLHVAMGNMCRGGEAWKKAVEIGQCGGIRPVVYPDPGKRTRVSQTK